MFDFFNLVKYNRLNLIRHASNFRWTVIQTVPTLGSTQPKNTFRQSVVSTLSRRGIITISLPFFPSNRIFSQTQSSSAVTDPLLAGRRPSPPRPPLPSLIRCLHLSSPLMIKRGVASCGASPAVSCGRNRKLGVDQAC